MPRIDPRAPVTNFRREKGAEGEATEGGAARTAGEIYPDGRSPFRPRAAPPLVQRVVPISADLRSYRTATLRRDLIAGVTVAALAMPASMAFAELAGLPAVTGLYALLLPVVAYVLAGSSKRLMIGPEGATAAMTGAALAPIAAMDPGRVPGAAAALALLVGLVFLAARVLRIGWLADYFSRPVLIGYIHGVAVVLLVGQLGKLTGASIRADTPAAQLGELLHELGSVSLATLGVSVIALAVLFGIRWLAPKLPAALIVVVGAIIVSAVFDLASHGVATIGHIPSGLPTFAWPGLRVDELDELLAAALGIFAVSFADSILTARSYAGKHQEQVDANQELRAFGLASLAAGVTQGFPVSSSGSRTAVADDMGARTQVAALFATVAVAVVLLFLTGPMEYLPTAVLGAVIFYAASGLIDPTAWRALARHSRRELIIAAVTAIGVMTAGILPALIIAVALSILDTVARSSRPHDAVLGYVPRLGRWADVRLHPSARLTPGIVVYRLDDRLFFANANYVKGRVREALIGAPWPVRWLIFDAESVITVDSTGLGALDELVHELRGKGTSFAMARTRGRTIEALAGAGFVRTIGSEHIYPTVSAAITALATPPPSTSGRHDLPT